MNRKKLRNILKELEALLEQDSIPELYNLLSHLSEIPRLLLPKLSPMLEEGTSGATLRANIKVKIQNVINNEKRISSRALIIELFKVEEKINEILREINQEEYTELYGYLRDLLEALSLFSNEYELYTRSYSLGLGISLSLNASELMSKLGDAGAVAMYMFVKRPQIEIKEELKELEIYLSNVHDLYEFGKKLQSIHVIYFELLKLYGESESDYPIEIINVENGSMLVKIAGHTLTASLLTLLLTAAFDFYMKEFSTTGQLAQLPVSIKAAEDILKISQHLEEDGVDTSEIKDYVESATRKIARNLDHLLSDQPHIELNNEVKKIETTMQLKLIETVKIAGLESKTETED